MVFNTIKAHRSSRDSKILVYNTHSLVIVAANTPKGVANKDKDLFLITIVTLNVYRGLVPCMDMDSVVLVIWLSC